MATVLWEIRRSAAPQPVRCELDMPEEGLYRIRILRGSNPEPFFEHSVTDERQVMRSSAVIYQELRSRGWRDVGAPADEAVTH